jgi:transaldolase
VKFFLDTADLGEIEEAASWGVLAGVTTNPTLYQRVGGKLAGFHGHLKRICEICEGPVSGETVGLTRDEIVREGEELAALAPNIVVKVPVMPEGLAAIKSLYDKGIKVNTTLCCRPSWPPAREPTT